MNSFAEITADTAVQGLLAQAHGNDVDLLDAYTGALAETEEDSALFAGPLLRVSENQGQVVRARGGVSWGAATRPRTDLRMYVRVVIKKNLLQEAARGRNTFTAVCRRVYFVPRNGSRNGPQKGLRLPPSDRRSSLSRNIYLLSAGGSGQPQQTVKISPHG